MPQNVKYTVERGTEPPIIVTETPETETQELRVTLQVGDNGALYGLNRAQAADLRNTLDIVLDDYEIEEEEEENGFWTELKSWGGTAATVIGFGIIVLLFRLLYKL